MPSFRPLNNLSQWRIYSISTNLNPLFTRTTLPSLVPFGRVVQRNICIVLFIRHLYVLIFSHYKPFKLTYLSTLTIWNWEKIYNLFKSDNLEITLKLKHLIFGYKISDKNYYGVNYFITILVFSIYKSYYFSEQKTKNVNVYNIFIYELNKRIDEIKKS